MQPVKLPIEFEADAKKFEAIIKSLQDQKVSLQIEADDPVLQEVVDELEAAAVAGRELEEEMRRAAAAEKLLNSPNVKELAETYEKAKTELEALAKMQRSALAELERTGQAGTEGYRHLREELEQTEQHLANIAQAGTPQLTGIDKLAADYQQARKEAESLVATQRAALAELERTGQTGTEGYRQLQEELAETEQHLANIAQAGGPQLTGIDKLAGDFQKVKKETEDMASTQRTALAEMQRTGQSGTQEYKELEEQLQKTEAQLEEIADAAKKVGDGGGGENPMEKLFKLEAAQGAAEFLNGMAEKANATRDAQNRMAAQTQTSGAELERLNAIAAETKAVLGGELATAIETTTAVQKQLKDSLTPEDFQATTIAAQAYSQAFEEDVNDSVAKASPLIEQFGLKGKEAFDLLAYARANVANADDDVMDSVKEFSQDFAAAKFSAAEFIGVLERGTDGGAFNTDKISDGLQESILRIQSAGDDVTVAFDEISGAPEALISKMKQTIASARSGDISIKDALQVSAQDIEEAFNAGQISDAVRAQMEIAIGGAPMEELGSGMFSKLFSQPIDGAAIEAKAKQAGQIMTDSMATSNPLEKMFGGAIAGAESLAGSLAPAIAPTAQLLTVATQLAPALDAVGMGKMATDALSWAKTIPKLVAGLFAQTTATTAQAGASGVATIAMGALNTIMALNPAFLVAGTVGLLVAGLVIFGSSTADIIEDLQGATEQAQTSLENAKGALAGLEESDKAAQSTKNLADSYDRLKDSTDPESQKEFAAASTELAAKVPQAKLAVDGLNESAQGTKDSFQIATDTVRAYADQQLAANQAMRDAAIAEVSQGLSDMAEASADAGEELADLQQRKKELNDQIAQRTEFGMDVSNVQEALNEVEINIGKITTAQGDATKATQEQVKFLREQGVSYTDIAQKAGLTVVEVKEIEKQQKLAEKAAKGTASATKGIADGAKQSTSAIKAMADAYNKVKAAADDQYSTSFAGVRKLEEELAKGAVNIKLLQAQISKSDVIAAIPLQIQLATAKAFQQEMITLKDQEFAAAKRALAEKKRLEREEMRLKLQLGEIDWNVEDFTQQAQDIRREIGQIFFEIANEGVEDQIAKQTAQIQQTLKDNLAGIDKQLNELAQKRANAPFGTILKGVGELETALKDKRKAFAKQAEAEIARLEAEIRTGRLDQLRQFLNDQHAVLAAGVARRIATLEREEDSISVVDEETLAEAFQKRQQIIGLQRQIELDGIIRNNDLYLTAVADVQAAMKGMEAAKTDAEFDAAKTRLDDAGKRRDQIRKAIIDGDTDFVNSLIDNDAELKSIEAKLAAATTDEQRSALEKRLTAYKEYLAGVRTSTLTDISGYLAFTEEKTAELEAKQAELGKALFDEQSAELQKKLDRERRVFEREAAALQRIIDASIEVTSSLGETYIDTDQERRLAQVEQQRAFELISEEEHEQEKTRIQAEAARQREALQARSLGIQLETERQMAIADLEIQRQHLEEQKVLAEEKGQIDVAKDLSDQLDVLKEEIESKGDTLTAITGELQGNLTELVSNLFTADEEKIKSPFRKVLQIMMGAIRSLASAKATELVLGEIAGWAGIPGLIKAIATKPIIDGIFNAMLTPLFNQLLAFPTGVRVHEPTLAIIGDAARLGGTNTETLMRDDQILAMMEMTAHRSSGPVVTKLNDVIDAIESMNGRIYILERDVYDAGKKQERRRSNRRVRR